MLAVKIRKVSLRICAGWRIVAPMNEPAESPRTPGQLIAALLAERGWTQRAMAVVLGIDETGVNRLVAGKRPVDAPLAIVLEELFNVPAEEFLRLQQAYDLAVARISARPDPHRAARAALYGDLPITEMIKRGWIDAENARDTKKVEASLLKFFGANRIEDIEILPHSAKKTEVNSDATPAQLAWLYRVRQLANDMLAGPYSPQAVMAAVSKLRGCMASPEGVARVPRIMSECGIRFVLVETLSSAKIDGVCFWLNDRSPVIGLSTRYDRIDNFWFVLRHEIEHVLQMHGRERMMLDAELEGERAGTGASVAEEERIANAAAQEFCVPSHSLEAFIARKAPFFAERDVIGFSRLLKVHPGIVVGQIHRRTGRYNLLREHLSKVRSTIAPNAIRDGWGDVAQIET